jgi:hypothetical protein
LTQICKGEKTLLEHAIKEGKDEEREFIEFPYSVKKLFEEMMTRHQREINDHLVQIYEEIGIKERVDNQKFTGETFRLRPNFSGLDVMKPKPKDEEQKDAGTEDDKKSSKPKKDNKGTGRGNS